MAVASNPIGSKRVKWEGLDCQEVGSNGASQYEPLRDVAVRFCFCGVVCNGVDMYAWGIVGALR